MELARATKVTCRSRKNSHSLLKKIINYFIELIVSSFITSFFFAFFSFIAPLNSVEPQSIPADDKERCNGNSFSSLSTLMIITVSVEGVLLVAATAVIVMLVIKQRRVKATKEGTAYKSAIDNFCVKIKFLTISVEDRKGAVLLRTTAKTTSKI